MKKRLLLIITTIFVCVAIILSATSCTARHAPYSITLFDYFNTFSTLTAYAESKREFETFSDLFSETLEQYHKLLNATEPAGDLVNIHYLNDNAANVPVSVSAELMDFLIFSKDMHTLTDGYTNVAMGALTTIWKDALTSADNDNGYLPNSDALSDASKHININSLLLDTEKNTVSFSDASLKLDAGALAKGYVSKILYDKLIAAGCNSFLINLGGNLTAHGLKNNTDSWLAGIENPNGSNDISDMSIVISERSISTSGSYNQSFTLGGEKYHHIIDPYTAYPQNRFVSVSVITDSIAEADALSTALFSMDKEAGIALVESIENTEAIWITNTGEYFVSNGFNNYKK